MMKQKSETRLLRQLTPQNLLSFGPATPPLALESLNLLIGPNGSGKSNLLEAIALLRATAGDLRQVVSRGGTASGSGKAIPTGRLWLRRWLFTLNAHSRCAIGWPLALNSTVCTWLMSGSKSRS